MQSFYALLNDWCHLEQETRTCTVHCSLVFFVCLLHFLVKQFETRCLNSVNTDLHSNRTQRTCACSGSGAGSDSMMSSICFAFLTRSATSSRLFSSKNELIFGVFLRKHKPSNFCGESILSFGRDFVTGMSGETCLKSERWTSWTTASFMISNNCSIQS